MQRGITHTDRKLLWGSGLVVLLLLAGTVALRPSADEQGTQVPSTYSSGSGGALAAYLLLVDLPSQVRRLEEPPAALASPGRGALLILAGPTQEPSKSDREALLHFVESGGRILFCGAAIPSFFPEASLSPRIDDPEWIEFFPALPSYISQAADKVVMRPAAYWGKLSSSQLRIYGEDGSPAVVAWRIGAGEVLWWAGATPLTNAGITRADNLELFLNAVSAPQGGEHLSIYWDEYFHGQRVSLWSYMEGTPVVWGFLQLAIFVAGLLFTFSRRSGPIAMPAVVSRLSPLEFVDTMGGLYQRADAASIAVTVSYRHLRLELTRLLGLPAAIPDPDLGQAAGERLGFDCSRLSDALQNAAIASSTEKLPARQALALVQQLERYFVQLRTPKPLSQEKD